MQPDITLGPLTVQLMADHLCLLCHRPAALGSWTCAGCGDRVHREAVQGAIQDALGEALDMADEMAATRGPKE